MLWSRLAGVWSSGYYTADGVDETGAELLYQSGMPNPHDGVCRGVMLWICIGRSGEFFPHISDGMGRDGRRRNEACRSRVIVCEATRSANMGAQREHQAGGEDERRGAKGEG